MQEEGREERDKVRSSETVRPILTHLIVFVTIGMQTRKSGQTARFVSAHREVAR